MSTCARQKGLGSSGHGIKLNILNFRLALNLRERTWINVWGINGSPGISIRDCKVILLCQSYRCGTGVDAMLKVYEHPWRPRV